MFLQATQSRKGFEFLVDLTDQCLGAVPENDTTETGKKYEASLLGFEYEWIGSEDRVVRMG